MIPFRLRNDARTWFKALMPELKQTAPLFELYYFCLAAGLAYGRKADVPSDDAPELVDNYPGDFKSRGRLLTAWLISAELKAMGISVQERSQVHQLISGLVHPQSPSHLSEHGVREMNRYASGGFEVLTERITDPPRSFPAFLIQFRKIIDQAQA